MMVGQREREDERGGEGKEEWEERSGGEERRRGGEEKERGGEERERRKGEYK